MACAAAAAKSSQSCPTLCDPIDGSAPGSPVPGILQARTLEWVAISFSNAWTWKVKVKSLSRVRLFTTPWTAAYQAPLSMGFSRQEYWSGVPLPSPVACALECNCCYLEKFSSMARWLWVQYQMRRLVKASRRKDLLKVMSPCVDLSQCPIGAWWKDFHTKVTEVHLLLSWIAAPTYTHDFLGSRTCLSLWHTFSEFSFESGPSGFM